jgi:hypothetical protein
MFLDHYYYVFLLLMQAAHCHRHVNEPKRNSYGRKPEGNGGKNDQDPMYQRTGYGFKPD